MGPGGEPGAGGEELGPHLHGRERPSLVPRAALQGDPDGDTWMWAGGGVGAGLGRAVLLQITRSETRQDRNLCLAWGAKEKISEGAILLFQQTLVGMQRVVCPGSSP